MSKKSRLVMGTKTNILKWSQGMYLKVDVMFTFMSVLVRKGPLLSYSTTRSPKKPSLTENTLSICKRHNLEIIVNALQRHTFVWQSWYGTNLVSVDWKWINNAAFDLASISCVFPWEHDFSQSLVKISSFSKCSSVQKSVQEEME